MATSPLHFSVLCCVIPTISGSVHLPNLQQGIFKTFKSAYSLPLTYRREAIQMPTSGMREGLQRPQQHEATRKRMPQLRGWCYGINFTIKRQQRAMKWKISVLMYKLQCFLFCFNFVFLSEWLLSPMPTRCFLIIPYQAYSVCHHGGVGG